MVPPYQSFSPSDLPVVDIDLGLEVNHEFISLKRATQIALERETASRLRIHIGCVELVIVSTLLFGLGQRRGRILHQGSLVVAIQRMQHNADTGSQVNLLRAPCKTRLERGL